MKTLTILYLICFLFSAAYSIDINSKNLQPPRGKLYGISSAVGLELIDTDTGSQTPIGSSHPHQRLPRQLSSIDAKHNIYYIIAQNSSSSVVQLIGFGLDNGDIVVQVPLPFLSTSFVGVGQFIDVEPSTGDVFLTGAVSATTYKHEMYRYVYQTKQLKLITSFNAIDTLFANSVFDAKHKIEFVTYSVNQSSQIHTWLEGYDVVTGKLVSKFAIKYEMSSLAFDPTTGFLVGLGTRSTGGNRIERVIVTLNGATGQYREVGVLFNHGEDTDLGGLSALDSGRRILYVAMSKGGNNDPFYLVSVHVDTAKVIGQAELCPASLSNCPWSIEFKPVH